MSILAVILILIGAAIAAIKDALTPKKPPIKDIEAHTRMIISLPDQKARQKYLKQHSNDDL